MAAAKEKERRNQELKDALEESERKMQEVEIIVSLIKVAAFFISFRKINSICPR